MCLSHLTGSDKTKSTGCFACEFNGTQFPLSSEINVN
jgi:hypothetical protein